MIDENTVNNKIKNIQIDPGSSPTLILKKHWDQINQKLDEGVKFLKIMRVLEECYQIKQKSYQTWYTSFSKIKKKKSNLNKKTDKKIKQKKVTWSPESKNEGNPLIDYINDKNLK